jgi:methylmalonyl-CoA mutase C-terminal domain/subunit
MIAEAALQEDVDVVGLSILSGAHNALVPAVIDKLTQNGLNDVKVFVGGIIPEDDIPNLEEKGVYAVYGPGTDTQRVVAEIKAAIDPKSE